MKATELSKEFIQLWQMAEQDSLEEFLSEDIELKILGIDPCVVGKNNVLKNIQHDLKYAGSEHGKLVTLEQFINEGKYHTPVLIFVQSKHRAIDLEKEL